MLEMYMLDFDWFFDKKNAYTSKFISYQLDNKNSRFLEDMHDLNFKFNYEVINDGIDLISLLDWIIVHIYLTIFYLGVYIFITSYLRIYSNIIINKKNKFKKIIWIDIWEINTQNINNEIYDNSLFNLYYKYKLSMLNTWHILEDRIIIFLIVIIFLI